MTAFEGCLDFNPEAVVASGRANNLPLILRTIFPQKKLYSTEIGNGLVI